MFSSRRIGLPYGEGPGRNYLDMKYKYTKTESPLKGTKPAKQTHKSKKKEKEKEKGAVSVAHEKQAKKNQDTILTVLGVSAILAVIAVGGYGYYYD